MDNPELRINGEGRERLVKALDLALGLHVACEGWSVQNNTLILLWAVPDHNKTANKFPAKIRDAGQLADMVLSWLKEQPESAYPNKYDGGDVVNYRGWLVFVEMWGHVLGEHYALCGIQPHYLWAGK